MDEVKRKIGGTAISKIFGLSRWGGPIDAYLSLTGITEDSVESEAAYWGKAAQPAILRRYNKVTGLNMALCDITYQHPEYDFITFTPDSLEEHGWQNDWPKSDHIVELKQTSVRDQYGTPGTDEVSAETGLQCQLYMGCCGAKTCDVAVHFLRPRHEFAIYHLTFNQDIFDNIIETARDFWENHVQIKIPPPLDASAGTKKLLAHLYPRDVEDVFAATPEIEELAERIKHFEFARDISVQELVLCQNRLKDLIGNHAGVVTSLGKVTWKKSRDAQVVDWKAAFDEFVDEAWDFFQDSRNIKNEWQELISQIIEHHTTTRPGSRRFVTKWNKEEA